MDAAITFTRGRGERIAWSSSLPMHKALATASCNALSTTQIFSWVITETNAGGLLRNKLIETSSIVCLLWFRSPQHIFKNHLYTHGCLSNLSCVLVTLDSPGWPDSDYSVHVAILMMTDNFYEDIITGPQQPDLHSFAWRRFLIRHALTRNEPGELEGGRNHFWNNT